MEKPFDFDNVGKRMPYAVPDGFFDRLQNNVADAARQLRIENRRKHRPRIVGTAALTAAAAALALVVLTPTSKPETSIDDVEQAFANLSETDRNYILDVYEEDIFINL